MSKTRLARVLSLGAVALAAGCSMAPKYERPEAPVAADWPGLRIARSLATAPAATASPAVQTIATADIEWQTFFNDPKLRQLIEAALRNNRDLRVAVLNIEQARAQFQIRRADQFPTVGAAVTGSRQPAAGGTIASVYTAGLALTSYEIDFFGRVASLKDAA
ncbi:MAG: multidrug transporter, partial [Haliea sp.]